MISANPGSGPPQAPHQGPHQRSGSLRWRMSATVLAFSLLLVLVLEFLHVSQGDEPLREWISTALVSALVRDLVLGVLLAMLIVWLLDRQTLLPLRRLAASSEAFDPTLPPDDSRFDTGNAAPSEVQKIQHSLSRVHRQLWQQLQSEQGTSAQLREQLRLAQAQLDAKNRELGTMARLDTLTGLVNRREFDEALRREFKRTQRQRGLLSLAVLDLDHFKLFNLRYGPAEGDVALRRVANLLSAHFKRDTDIVARLGGEEFVALLPDLGLSEAQARLEQLREELRALGIPHEDGVGEEKALTISIGLAAYSPAHPYLSPQALMQAADEALYIAKHAGRDRLSMGAN
ncbi:GGDEF domain-containing protein [Burkholderiaceae bacterium UC74_6]